ncbi:uncharacterized protein [Macrobrachium rosenbergii]|uniref:uncharacterized protein n=1 Tax=Macrobrachium rosenbergii TaxID=79674 RepID=UPI0034D6787E
MMKFGRLKVMSLIVAVLTSVAYAENVTDEEVNEPAKNSFSLRSFRFFNPEKPDVSGLEKTKQFDIMMKYKIESIAYGIEFFTNMLDPIFSKLENDSVSIKTRFPYRIMPHSQSVAFSCKRGFLKCVDFLSEAFASHGLTIKAWLRRQDSATQKAFGSNCTALKIKKKYTDTYLSWTGCLQTDPLVSGTPSPPDLKNTDASEIVDHYKFLLTSMQFMCWYTTHNVKYLSISKPCSYNHLNPTDCAFGAFCPKPCWDLGTDKDICTSKGSTGKCHVKFEDNRNFHRLLTESINVTCICKEGYVHEKRAQNCVGRYYYKEMKHSCNPLTQDPFYVPNHLLCRCKIGHFWDNNKNICKIIEEKPDSISLEQKILGALDPFINFAKKHELSDLVDYYYRLIVALF